MSLPLWVWISFLMVRNSSRMACRVLLQLHIQQLGSVAMAAGAGGKAVSESEHRCIVNTTPITDDVSHPEAPSTRHKSHLTIWLQTDSERVIVSLCVQKKDITCLLCYPKLSRQLLLRCQTVHLSTANSHIIQLPLERIPNILCFPMWSPSNSW